MNFRNCTSASLLVTFTAGLGHVISLPLCAQDLNSIAAGNAAFDQQANAMLQGQIQQNQMAQQQLMQSYLQQHGPQLQQQYQQFIQSTGYQIPFETFVYNHMLTAGGTNPGPALQQQQRNFQGLQDAHRTVQQGNDNYNQGWRNNQETTSNALQRYDQQGIRGDAYYRNPQTGQVYELPYGGVPGVYGNSQNTFYNDPTGNYVQMDPQGYGTALEQQDAYDHSAE